MTTQLLLISQPEANGRNRGQAHWQLDEQTRAIGLRGVAEARALLRARRRSAHISGPAAARPAA